MEEQQDTRRGRGGFQGMLIPLWSIHPALLHGNPPEPLGNEGLGHVSEPKPSPERREGREGSARRGSVRASLCRCPCPSPGGPRQQQGQAGPVPSLSCQLLELRSILPGF